MFLAKSKSFPEDIQGHHTPVSDLVNAGNVKLLKLHHYFQIFYLLEYKINYKNNATIVLFFYYT